jgi:hypothetical protein
MNTAHKKNPPPCGYTDKELHDYAHHLWIQAGMKFDQDPWGEARACLEHNRPRVRDKTGDLPKID